MRQRIANRGHQAKLGAEIRVVRIDLDTGEGTDVDLGFENGNNFFLYYDEIELILRQLPVPAIANSDLLYSVDTITGLLTINPKAAHVLANIGYSRFLAGDVDGAITDLYAAANDKGFVAAWGNLATVYASYGDYENAVTAFRKVMNDANSYNATGKIAMKNGDNQQAFALLSEAIAQSTTYFPEAEESLRRLQAGRVTVIPTSIADIRDGEARE